MDKRVALGPTAQEFEAIRTDPPWLPEICRYCGEERSYHWQTKTGAYGVRTGSNRTAQTSGEND